MRKEHNEYTLMKVATAIAVVTLALAVVAILLVVSPLGR